MFLRDFTDTCMECGSILLEPCNSRIDWQVPNWTTCSCMIFHLIPTLRFGQQFLFLELQG
jgi:hypothetical protein